MHRRYHHRCLYPGLPSTCRAEHQRQPHNERSPTAQAHKENRVFSYFAPVVLESCQSIQPRDGLQGKRVGNFEFQNSKREFPLSYRPDLIRSSPDIGLSNWEEYLSPWPEGRWAILFAEARQAVGPQARKPLPPEYG